MHSLCALNLNASILNGLDNLLYNTLGKIFKTVDHKILKFLHVLYELLAHVIWISMQKN